MARQRGKAIGTRRVAIIGGPNGAGKSTNACRLLTDSLGIAEFVNADVIASGLSGLGPAAVALEAGRVMHDRLRELASEHKSFAFETTLASRSFAPWIRSWKEAGYEFHLAFFWLPSPDMAVARVARRVSAGGHDVPESDIRRRYRRGLINFFALYQPLADRWTMYNNTQIDGPLVIATGRGRDASQVDDGPLWDRIREEHAS